MRTLFLVAASFALASCVPPAPQDMTAVKAAVATFHDRQANGHDDQIYADATQALRDAASSVDMKRLSDTVRAALVNCPPPPEDPIGINWYRGTDGYKVTVSYSRTCSNGDFTEQFVFRFENDVPKLLGYNIQGMALFPAATAKPPATDTTTTAPSPSPSAPASTTPSTTAPPI